MYNRGILVRFWAFKHVKNTKHGSINIEEFLGKINNLSEKVNEQDDLNGDLVENERKENACKSYLC